MFHIQGSFIRTAIVATVFAAGGMSSIAADTTAIADAPSTGLGQSWPNAPDVSASPHWHVYIFMLHGIKYVQVNDLNGTVHAAIEIVNGTSMVLPMGVDSLRVVERVRSAVISRRMPGAEIVYSDATTTVLAVPQNDGTTRFYTEDTCTSPYSCSSGSN